MELNKRAFFVMAFGKEDLERVWNTVYLPISTVLGFDAIRIDERDNGRVKIDQIINELSTADVIIGDLTYERPNCYFELGYARAIRKEDLIIHCARKDHVDHSQYRSKRISFERPLKVSFSFRPPYSPPRVHFDLAAFDILLWDPNDLDGFKPKFERRLRERMVLIEKRSSIASASATPPTAKPQVPLDLDTIASKLRREWEDS